MLVWVPNPDTRQNFLEKVNIASNKLPPIELRQKKKSAQSKRNPISLTIEMKKLLDSGEVASKAGIARKYGLSRARVTQIMNLLKLPSEITDFILWAYGEKKFLFSESRLRKILRLPSAQEQIDAFELLKEELEIKKS